MRGIRAEHAAGIDPGEREAALAGVRCEGVHVHESDDLAGVSRDVRDHRSAVGVPDEHDRPVDGADEVADGGSVGGQATQRIGRGPRRLPCVDEQVDDRAPARGLRERAVDEDDGRFHEGSFPLRVV